MAYDNWTIGGVTVPHVRTVTNDQPSRTITLSCSALTENIESGEPRDEIALFEEMSCDVITNTQLMNGGSCLQVCNGDPVIVSDGVDAWVAALERPVINENKLSEKRIDYDLVIHYETVPRGITYTTSGDDETEEEIDEGTLTSKRYYPPLKNISDVTNYWQYTSYTNDATGNYFQIGAMVINTTRNVSQVIIKGAAMLTPAWIEINSDRKYWYYSNYALIVSNFSNVEYPIYYGNETLTWNLTTPTTTINILTSTHVPDHWDDGKGIMSYDASNNHGAIIDYIEVVFE